MINANVLKGVNELLDQDGIRLDPDENFGDMVARKLDISSAEAEVLLESLHDGANVEQAAAAAGIDPNNTTLISIARAIGSTLGRIAR